MVVSSVGAGDHVRRPRLLHVASASELMHGWKDPGIIIQEDALDVVVSVCCVALGVREINTRHIQ